MRRKATHKNYDRPQDILLFIIFCIFLVFAVTAALVIPSVHAGSTQTSDTIGITIKPHTSVENETLYLSDLFSGIKPNRDAIIGRSPNPGEELEIGPVLLSRIAKAYHLGWKPASFSERVIIRRSASIITGTDISDAVENRLRQSGVDGTFIVNFYGESPSIILPERLPPEFEFSSFSFDPATDRFRAEIVAPAKTQIHKQIELSGTVERLINIPVLNKSLRNGHVITARDIEMISMRIKTLGDDVLVDKNAVIGMTPDRFLVSKKPIRKTDIRAPMMVQRGQRITLVHRSGPLNLSAAGRSMQNGSKGEIIRVVNIDSNKNLQAEIIGDGLAQIIQ